MAKVNPGGYRGVWNPAGGNATGYDDTDPRALNVGGAGGPSYFFRDRNIAFGRWTAQEQQYRNTIGRAPNGATQDYYGASNPAYPWGPWSGWKRTPTQNSGDYPGVPRSQGGPNLSSNNNGIIATIDAGWVRPGKWKASGGAETTPGDGYRYHTFDPTNSPLQFRVTGNPAFAKGVEIALGGSGGSGGQYGPGPGNNRPLGGGGGGGAVVAWKMDWKGTSNVSQGTCPWGNGQFTMPAVSGSEVAELFANTGSVAAGGTTIIELGGDSGPGNRPYPGGGNVPGGDMGVCGVITAFAGIQTFMDGTPGQNGADAPQDNVQARGGYGGAYPFGPTDYWWVPEFKPADRGLGGPVRGNEHEQNPWPGTSPSPIWRPGEPVGGGGGGGSGGSPNNGWPDLPGRPGAPGKMIIRYLDN